MGYRCRSRLDEYSKVKGGKWSSDIDTQSRAQAQQHHGKNSITKAPQPNDTEDVEDPTGKSTCT